MHPGHYYYLVFKHSNVTMSIVYDTALLLKQMTTIFNKNSVFFPSKNFRLAKAANNGNFGDEVAKFGRGQTRQLHDIYIYKFYKIF